MFNNEKESKPKQKTLQLRADDHTSLGKIITYLQAHIVSSRKLNASTLEARFLPFVMDKDDPEFFETAIECAEICEAWGATIRQYAGLNVEPIQQQINQITAPAAKSNPAAKSQKKNNSKKPKTEKTKKPSSGKKLLGDLGLF